MKTLTLKIDDRISDQFTWLLEHFSPNKVQILEQSEYIDDDTDIRGIPGIKNSILEARNESE
ncbi:hypothetical protein Thiowin_03431 [Thiorhodovibrio winogradskyi]|uniref:Uncharacterized protein n=1 Tax=Thiorhodovibrio winogradskyi TaxID=77007 RepID=A0ABZ0SCP1_9GAMM|nr:hypothetical protein [Thiorhodovibrio winogradskyi]